MNLLTRLLDAWAVLTGSYVLPSSPTERKFRMSLDKFNAAAAQLSAAADRLIAKSQADDAALATASQLVADADDQATSTIQPIVDRMIAASPAPATDAAMVEQPVDAVQP